MKTPFLKLGLLFLAGCNGTQAQPVNAPNLNALNLASGKKFVSSDPNTRNWNGGLTDDSWLPGRGTTFATNDSEVFPKTVTLDLETVQTLGYVALGVPPFGSTKTVGVSLSLDGNAFVEVGRTTFLEAQEKQQLFEFKPFRARFVRLTYLDHHAKKHGYNPAYAFTTELAVYAPGTPPVLPLSPTSTEAADQPAFKKGVDGLIHPGFLQAHQSFLRRGKEAPIGVLLVGDSITDFWRRDNAKASWAQLERFNPANFGIGGDKTQNVLWRFENGELDGIQPKVVVVMIGTNNMKLYSEPEIVRADQKIVAEIRRRLPDSEILLLGIFPRGAKATDPARAKIKSINAELAKLDDGKQIRYLDIGDKFLAADGTLGKEIMPDALHPSPAGYQIWADALAPVLDAMIKG